MYKLNVTEKELFMLVDAVNMLQSASVYTHKEGNLYEDLSKLLARLVQAYTQVIK